MSLYGKHSTKTPTTRKQRARTDKCLSCTKTSDRSIEHLSNVVSFPNEIGVSLQRKIRARFSSAAWTVF